MWGYLPSCIRRHKKKLLFFGGVVGGIAILNTYLKRKFIEWESQQTSDICEQIKRSNHFEAMMNTCNSSFISCSRHIREAITKAIDVNQVVEQVSANPPNKIQLWEELKIMVFTQALGEMYAHCLLCILLRVQMSILSGYMYVSRCTNNSTSEQQLKYMSRIQDFLLNGIPVLLGHIRKAVEENLKNVPLHWTLKLKDVEMQVKAIHSSMFVNNSNALQDISCCLMHVSSSSLTNDDFLDNISLETKDVIECRDFNTVLESCIECGMSSLMDRFSECYVILSDGKDGFINPHDFPTQLAKLIPLMHNVFSQHTPTEPGALVHSLLQLEPLNKFAANIYEAFSQKS